MERTRVKLPQIFQVCFYISALTIGGGYVIVGLLQKRLVERLKWLDEDEMLDIVALAQSSPGAVAINAANLVGWRLRGAAGAAAAILGSILPPMAIIIAIGFFYLEFREYEVISGVLMGMTAGVTAIILDVVIGMLSALFKNRKVIPIIICFLAFVFAFFTGVNVAFILITAGLFGALYGVRKGKIL